MARKLAIANIVKVPVKFTLNNGGKIVPFAFNLTCNRVDVLEIQAFMKDGEKTPIEFLRDVITGWDGQKLVLEEDGAPAEFDTESLDMMLNTTGVAMVIYNAYLKECGAKEKN